MRKKIGIVELDYHFEVLLNTLLIFSRLDYDIYVFTKSSYCEQLKEIGGFDCIFVAIGKDENVAGYLKKNEVLMNQMDLLIFDTFELYFKEITQINLSVRSVVRVHNLHTYFTPLKYIKLAKNLYYLLVDVKYLLQNILLGQELKYRKMFYKKVDYFTFPTDIITKYAVDNNFVSKEKVVESIPFTLHQPEFRKEKETDVIYITLPGTVDIRRRNYFELLEAFMLIKDKVKQKVELTFLGKPKNKYELTTIKRFRNIENNFIKFRYYEKWVPQGDFDALMQKTDFFVVPLYEYVKFRVYNETYGYSKISGNINDIVKYGKPALVSEKYPLENHFEKVIQRYCGATELADYLLDWIENRTFNKLNQSISETLDLYSLDNVSKATDKILQGLLK